MLDLEIMRLVEAQCAGRQAENVEAHSAPITARRRISSYRAFRLRDEIARVLGLDSTSGSKLEL